jgi:mono/diheme cytochrome c family protein
MKTVIAAIVTIAGAVLTTGSALHAAEVTAQSAPTLRGEAPVEREVIPGAHLMTAAEREDYRARIQAAGSAAEQARIRAEHIEAMEARARNLGLSLRREEPRAAQTVVPKGAVGGDVKRGAALHNVCFSCHGPERYRAAGARAAGFFASSLATAGGIEYVPPANASERRPDTLPAGYPKMGRSQVRNLTGLRKAIARWNDYFNPKLTEEELDDLVAYLNAAYYKF